MKKYEQVSIRISINELQSFWVDRGFRDETS